MRKRWQIKKGKLILHGEVIRNAGFPWSPSKTRWPPCTSSWAGLSVPELVQRMLSQPRKREPAARRVRWSVSVPHIHTHTKTYTHMTTQTHIHTHNCA